jgi:hypothetical protein
MNTHRSPRDPPEADFTGSQDQTLIIFFGVGRFRRRRISALVNDEESELVPIKIWWGLHSASLFLKISLFLITAYAQLVHFSMHPLDNTTTITLRMHGYGW